MEGSDNTRVVITLKSPEEVREELEINQRSNGDCLSTDFVSTLPKMAHLDLAQNNLSDLRDIWVGWDRERKKIFTEKYGDIALLLSVKVDPHFLRAMVNFWDPSHHCFVFNQEDMTPSIEEYSALLRIQDVCHEKVFWKEQRARSVRKKLSKILGVDLPPEGPYIMKKEANEGVPWTFLQSYINSRSEDPRSMDAFALAIYGLVIFPKILGHVEVSVVDLFERLDKNVNPAPAILAETIRSLNYCRRMGKGRILGCIPLLYIWARSHFWDASNLKKRIFRKDFTPIAEFCGVDWSTEWDKEKWIGSLRNISREDVTWKAPWMLSGPFLYSCGDYPWVPLLGIWGIVSYAPSLVQRQFGFQQFIPATHGLGFLEFAYEDQNSLSRARGVITAWRKLNKSEGGVYSSHITPSYQVWRAARISDTVLPPEDPTKNSGGFRPKPIVLTEAEILRQEFNVEEKKLKDENRSLRESVGQLKFNMEVQTAKVRKLTEEQALTDRDSKRLKAEIPIIKKKLLRGHEIELGKAREEAEYWKNKAREHEELAIKYSSETKKWEDKYLSTSSKLKVCLQDNEKLKSTVSAEKLRISQKHVENESLKEVIHTLEHELRSQKQDIMALLHKQQEKENDLIYDLHQAQDEVARWEAESFGRQYYIDHLTKEMQKAVTKAWEMVEKVSQLRQVVSPTERHGQQVLNFLAEAQDQYEQIRRFFGYNPNMI